MAKTVGYMITWTTYGTWLQGDKRGYVKKGKIYPANPSLTKSNQQKLIKNPITLSPAHRAIVKQALYEKGKRLNQKIHAVAVRSNHVHIIADYIPMPIGSVVRIYKNSAQVALRKACLCGRVWTKGFDKRYCFDRRSLEKRIDYVNSHNK
jgi:REP element-mobilizing transposase RayT